ncbi:hypothetical protein [Methylocapsa sp. S129]|uniref:hypothetical protein n=1 Tax=Methylocapsa sp. S129 TaxID=1641869 RepID=UPI00131D0C67|nr:hypothetical protein [Methylocapsa sp. S129]
MNRFFMRGATVGASAPGRDSAAGEALDCGLTPTPEDAERSTPAWLWWGGLALLVAGLIAPILAVDVPPLADYPNHLARCFFLAFGAEDPVLQSMFATHWDLIPNLAIDLILPPLMHIMPPLLAGKLVVALTVLLPATGTIALSRACFGRLSLWQLGAGFVSYNAMFLIGLLNFQLAVGVALWGAAAWIATSSRHPFVGALIGAGFALVAFVFHIFGFCFFALLIGCAELAAILRRGFDDAGAWRFALGRTVTTTAALLPTAALYTVSPLAGANGHTVSLPLASKLILLLAPVLGYSPWIQQAVAVALFITLLAWWRARGQLLVAPLAWACLPLLLLIYAALPVGAKGGYWIDTRMPVLFGYTLFATTMPHRLGRREAVVATMAFLALFVGRMAYITEIWAGSQQDVADVRRALTPVTPGSRVLMMQANPYQHAASLGDDAAQPHCDPRAAPFLLALRRLRIDRSPRLLVRCFHAAWAATDDDAPALSSFRRRRRVAATRLHRATPLSRCGDGARSSVVPRGLARQIRLHSPDERGSSPRSRYVAPRAPYIA